MTVSQVYFDLRTKYIYAVPSSVSSIQYALTKHLAIMVNDYIPEWCMIVLAPVLSVYCVYRPDQLKYSNERTQIILSISLIVSIIKRKQQPQETKEELKKLGSR